MATHFGKDNSFITELYIYNVRDQGYSWLYRLPHTIEEIEIEKCNIGQLPELPKN